MGRTDGGSEELAREQGVQPLADAEALAGGWPEDGERYNRYKGYIYGQKAVYGGEYAVAGSERSAAAAAGAAAWMERERGQCAAGGGGVAAE